MIESDRGPRLTVDVIIRVGAGVVLVKRRFPPPGWALPGGFVETGESAEDAALRESIEETGLSLSRLRQFRLYSTPDRDPRGHTASMVFTARATGDPIGGDDAKEARVFSMDALPEPLAFDHAAILAEYARGSDRRKEGER